MSISPLESYRKLNLFGIPQPLSYPIPPVPIHLKKIKIPKFGYRYQGEQNVKPRNFRVLLKKPEIIDFFRTY